MEQFKPPKKSKTVPGTAAPPALISRTFFAKSVCGSLVLSVDYSTHVEVIGPQLLIEDLHPGGLLLSNLVNRAFTFQISDPRGSRLLATYGSDTGYSGYAMLHSVLGDQKAIDMEDVRCLKEMRCFVNSLRVMAGSSFLREEMDCVLSYMNGVIGCWHRSLPETGGIWLGVTEIRDFAGTDERRVHCRAQRHCPIPAYGV